MSTKTIQGRGVPTRLAWWMTVAVMGVAVAGTFSPRPSLHAAVGVLTRFVGPTSSQPLALTANGAFLVAANPDNDSVSFFDVRADREPARATVPVQNEPNGVAFLPDGCKAYVANTVSGTVSVIAPTSPTAIVRRPTSPHSGRRTSPTRSRSHPTGPSSTWRTPAPTPCRVIDTATETVIETIPVGPRAARPRDHERRRRGRHGRESLRDSVPVVLVSGKIDGAEERSRAGHGRRDRDGHGRVRRCPSIRSRTRGSAPLATRSRGFRPARSSLPTGAYPNQLNNVAMQGQLRVPAEHRRVAQRARALRRQHAEPALRARQRRPARAGATTINMHQAVAHQTGLPKLFITQPWAIAFKHAADQGYVVSAASNIVVKVAVDPATGAPTVADDPARSDTRAADPRRKEPARHRGQRDRHARVRDELRVARRERPELTGRRERCWRQSPRRPVPAPGTAEDTIHIGKELYNTSVGASIPRRRRRRADRRAGCRTTGGAPAPPAILSGSDKVVWIFPAGPRRTIPQHADFDPSDATRSRMRMLNWSANRDEQEDFELNIRAVSGGQGPDRAGRRRDAGPGRHRLPAAGERRAQSAQGAGRGRLGRARRRSCSSAFARRSRRCRRPSPMSLPGRALFTAANCQSCHGGSQWTTRRVRFTPPPEPAQIVNGQIIGELRQVGTFDPTLFNEIRQNAAPPLGANGFVPPSLLSAFAFEGPQLPQRRRRLVR